MSALSDDAKGLFSCLFSLPIAQKTVLQFHMQEIRPTSRGQAALDELVNAGYLYRESLPGSGVSYHPLGPRLPNYRKLTKFGNFPFTEKMDSEPPAKE